MQLEQFKQILDCIGVPVFILDNQYKFIYVNNAICKLTGISREQWIGKTEYDLFPGEQADIFLAHNRHVMETGEEDCNEEMFTDAQGNIRMIMTTKTLYTGDTGERYVVATTRDITERKHAEKAMQESEKRFRMLANNASDIIYVHSLDGEYKYVSPSVKRVRGYSPEELIGRSIFSFMTPETAELVKMALAEELENEKAGADPNRVRIMELEMIGKDGSVVWTEIKSTILRNDSGNVVEIMGIARDVTERKKMEQALAESEKKYHMLADNATDVIFIFGLDFKYKYISPSVKKIRGFSPEELVGQPISHSVKPESLEQMKRILKEELESDKNGNADPDRTRLMEVEMLCKGGSTIWVEVKVLAMRNENGEAVEILGISRDITERKRIENALREGEEKYRVLVEKANEAIVIIQEGVFVFCNRRASNLLGIPPDVIIGKYFSSFVWPEDRELVIMNYKKRMSGEQVQNYDVRLVGSGGRLIWVVVSGTLIQLSGKQAVLALMTDITDRKKAEEERENLIRELRDALSSVNLLSGMLPICASCKKIRNDKGYWEQIEMYIKSHSEAEFSHGICPECAKKLYPEFYDNK